uniref:Transposase, mutator type n=1 Tax=Tanacetum cinerariifolium TaxID=118510 RepID=A0A699I5K9_TANCI|nr:transposase, mutator type [Tanacetum cinerariifolium]
MSLKIAQRLIKLHKMIRTLEVPRRTPKLLTLEIHHGGWFTPIPSRSYIGGQVSSVNVVDIDEFCLHNLKDMIVELGYGVEDLMYCHFLIPSLGLDYGLHSLNVDADVLEMAKYVKDDNIILVYAKHESSNVDTSIFVTPKKGVAIVVDNHLRKAPIEIDDVNRNLTPMCHRILKKKCAEDPFEELDDILNDDLDVIDYDSFGSDLDDGIDSERRMQLKELIRIGKQKNKGPNKYYFYLGQQFASKEIVKGRVKKHSKQFEVGVSKMKAFRIKRIAYDIITGIYREQYSLLREYAQELINQNPSTTVRIDVQQEPNPESLTRTFRRVYVCLGALKQGFRACGREILGLDGCFMLGPWPGQILTTVGVDANDRIYPVTYAIVEVESKRLIQAIASVFPSAGHRYCVRHIHENMKSQFKGGHQRRGRSQMMRASQSASSGKLSRKGKLVSCGKCGNVGHNKKGCRGQGGGSSQASARKVSGQAAGVTNVSGQAAGARKVSDQAVGATNVSGQAAGARKVSSQAAGATNVYGQAAGVRKVYGQAAGSRKVSGQAIDARKASSQPSATQSTSKQGPRQGF